MPTHPASKPFLVPEPPFWPPGHFGTPAWRDPRLAGSPPPKRAPQGPPITFVGAGPALNPIAPPKPRTRSKSVSWDLPADSESRSLARESDAAAASVAANYWANQAASSSSRPASADAPSPAALASSEPRSLARDSVAAVSLHEENRCTLVVLLAGDLTPEFIEQERKGHTPAAWAAKMRAMPPLPRPSSARVSHQGAALAGDEFDSHKALHEREVLLKKAEYREKRRINSATLPSAWNLLACVFANFFLMRRVCIDFASAGLCNMMAEDQRPQRNREVMARTRLENLPLYLKNRDVREWDWGHNILSRFPTHCLHYISCLSFTKDCHPGLYCKCTGYNPRCMEAMVQDADALAAVFQAVWRCLASHTRFGLWFALIFLCAAGKHRSVAAGNLTWYCLRRMGFNCSSLYFAHRHSIKGCPTVVCPEGEDGCNRAIESLDAATLGRAWDIWCRAVLQEPFMTDEHV